MPGQVTDSLKYVSLGPNDFHLQYLKNDSALLIDVRESFEFRGKRLKDAINIPSSGNLEFASDTLDKNLALFLYCTSGFRSKRVAEYFSGRGFRKVYSLDGGITEWKKERFPVVKGRQKRRGR
jgi:rhodanese-related sulfurtransferase